MVRHSVSSDMSDSSLYGQTERVQRWKWVRFDGTWRTSRCAVRKCRRFACRSSQERVWVSDTLSVNRPFMWNPCSLKTPWREGIDSNTTIPNFEKTIAFKIWKIFFFFFSRTSQWKTAEKFQDNVDDQMGALPFIFYNWAEHSIKVLAREKIDRGSIQIQRCCHKAACKRSRVRLVLFFILM